MLARNGLFSLAGSIIPVLATVVTLPFLLELIGATRYGALALAWLILVYSGQIVMGLGTALTHSVARSNPDDGTNPQDTIVTGLAVSLVLNVATAVIASTASWVFFAYYFEVDAALRAELLDIVWLIGASTFVSGLLQTCYSALIGKERFPTASVALMIGNGGMPVLALAAAYWIGPDMSALLASTLISRALGLIIAAADLWFSLLRKRRARFDRASSRQLLRFGFWITIIAITAPVLITLDRLVIGAQLGAVAVAAYTIPFQIISRLQLIPQSAINVIFPRLSVAEGKRARDMACHYAVLMSGLFAPIIIGLIFLIEPLLGLWLGDNLDPRSAPVGIILLCAFLLTSITQASVVYLQSQSEGRFVALFQLCELIPYLGLLIYATTQFGLLGAAAALLVRRAVEAVIFVQKAGFGLVRFWLTQVPAAMGIVVALVAGLWVDVIVGKVALATVVAVLTLAMAYRMAPDAFRNLIKEQLQKRLAPG